MVKARQLVGVVDRFKDQSIGRIIVLTGARQVGKTTLVREYMDDYEYLSVEDPFMREVFSRMSADMWKDKYPKAALDEVQKLPSLIDSIKAVYDKYSDTRYILLGSSQIRLLKSVKESLAGRCVIVDMYPLTLPEMRSDNVKTAETSIFQKLVQNAEMPSLPISAYFEGLLYAEKAKMFDHYCRFGGYPSLVDVSLTDEMRYEWLNNYIRTYLERDVRDMALLPSLEPFAKLQRILAARTAQLLNISDLSKDSGISMPTVKNYLEYLRLSYQTIELQPWNRNFNKRYVKSGKVHFLDGGVVQILLQKRGGMTGAEYESAIVSEIYKQVKNLHIQASFYHLRTHDGREVDLLVELMEGYIAFEIKMTEKVVKSDVRHLLDLEPLLDKPLVAGFVISNDPDTTEFTPKIKAVNAAMFLG